MLDGIFKGVGHALQNAWNGAHDLHSVPRLVGLGISVAICSAAIIWRKQFLALETLLGRPAPMIAKILLLIVAILAPIIYLNIINGLHHEEPAAFEEIGFLEKNGLPPRLAYTREEKTSNRSVKIIAYQSFIPLEKWRSSQAELETALNCTIRSIAQGRDKRTVEIATISSELTIPESIPWSDQYIQKKDGTLCIGVDQLQSVTFNLNKTPHVLVAGETGSGKSVILRTILWQAINAGSRIYMVDFKGGVEFGKRFEEYGEVIMTQKRALAVFQILVAENAERLALFRELEVKNLPEYNNKTGHNLCRIMVFIDEIAEMLDKTGADSEEKELIGQLEGCLSSLARLSRATGINLIIGVQRPDAKILTGQIKNNVPVRICGRFADRAPSEIVLGNSMACYLPDIKGRFLYRMGNEMTEFQAFLFVDDKDLHHVEVTPGDMLISGGRAAPEESETAPAEIPSKAPWDPEAAPAGDETAEEKRAKRPPTQRPRTRNADNDVFGVEDFEEIEEDY